MKRGCKSSSSSDTLTGGSGDVNPQILSYIHVSSYANAVGSQAATATFANPVWDLNRSIQLGCDKSKAYAMEVLSVDLINENIPVNAALAVAIGQAQWASLSNEAGPPAPLPAGSGLTQTWEWIMNAQRGVAQNDTTVLATQAQSTYCSSSTGPSGSPYTGDDSWKHFDLTDGDGHGVLCGAAVFNLRYAVRFSAAPAAIGDYHLGCRIKYRVKAISYQDWVRQFTFGV